MSIGLVLRHTYQETCEICEQIAHYLKVVGSKLDIFFTRVGYARAASELVRMGKYDEAKALMTEKDKLK